MEQTLNLIQLEAVKILICCAPLKYSHRVTAHLVMALYLDYFILLRNECNFFYAGHSLFQGVSYVLLNCPIVLIPVP